MSDVPVSFPTDTHFVLRKGIDCFDVSKDHVVVGGKDGLMRAGPAHVNAPHAVELNGHLSDLRAVKIVRTLNSGKIF